MKLAGVELGDNVVNIENDPGRRASSARVQGLLKSFWVVTQLHLAHPYDVVHVHSVPDFEVETRQSENVVPSSALIRNAGLNPVDFDSTIASKRGLIVVPQGDYVHLVTP